MKRKIMALCDPETDYMGRLSEYLERKSRLPFHICCFNDAGLLAEFCERETVELVLIAEGIFREELLMLPVGQMMLLLETGEETQGTLWNIGKYQSSENIYREIMRGYAGAAELEKEPFPTGRMKIIGNYSPVRRCLQTTFALCMGQLLAGRHRVLYLNFESYSGFSYMLNREFTADMSDVLYFFRCEKERLADRLGEMVQSVNGLDFIPPALSYEDLSTVTGKQMVTLLREIEKAAGYDYLILDLSEQMPGLFDLLSECHKIYTITGQDSFAAAKMRQYEMLLRMNDCEEVEGKTRRCGLPVFRSLPDGLERLTHGELASYVKKIIEEDLDGSTGKNKNKTEGTAPSDN